MSEDTKDLSSALGIFLWSIAGELWMTFGQSVIGALICFGIAGSFGLYACLRVRR